MLQFLIHLIVVIASLFFAFIMRKKQEMPFRERAIYYALAILCVIIIVMKGIFVLNPALEAMWMPVAIYSIIDRTYSFLTFVIFLTIISVLAQPRERKTIYGMLILFSIYVIYLPCWRLTTPVCYSYEGVGAGGVCFQSSPYTCGASAMVNLLSQYNIKATEGEMARLSETIPFKGVSNFQAVAGLNRKLAQENSNYVGGLKVYSDDELDKINTPCLTAIKCSIFFDHMICILKVEKDFVEVIDSLKGKRNMTREKFLEQWRNVNIEMHEN